MSCLEMSKSVKPAAMWGTAALFNQSAPEIASLRKGQGAPQRW